MDNNENYNEDKKVDVVGKVAAATAGTSVTKEILDWVLVIVIAFVAAFVIRRFLFTMVAVDGHSMDYTLADGDRLCVLRFNYTPKAGDIIVFNPYGDDSRPYIKRIIALGGQSIFVDADGTVYVDNKAIKEDYLGSPTTHGIAFYVDSKGVPTNDTTKENQLVYPSREKPYVIPDNYVFAMGDNRSNSHDCRDIGPVNDKDIVGHAVFRVFPFNTFGVLK